MNILKIRGDKAKLTADRPAKNILLFLLINIQLSIIPLYMSLPPAVVLLILIFSVWQFYIVLNDIKSPAKSIRLLNVIFVFLSLIFIYGNLFGRQPGISLIILMTVLKIFEVKSHRDCYVIIYSCFFIIASTFFQSQSVWLILYVMMVVITLTMSLIKLSDRRHSLSLKYSLWLASRYVMFALPFMLILFVLFPRIPGPLWALPADAYAAQTGLSEEMSPGSINRLISSSAIAFRVKFDGDIPKHTQRYWRGAVLSDYDGKTWRRKDAPKETQANIVYDENSQQRYRYTVTLEPGNLNWILSLEYTSVFDPAYRLNREAMLLSKTKINKVISYKLESQTDAKNIALYKQEEYKNRLILLKSNPKTIELTKDLLKKSDYDKQRYITNVLQYFVEGGFVYTLKPDLLADNIIDEFLFDSKRGFCEHYASAFTYLMRAAGIPARVVIGYQGGTMNPLDDYMIVRQSDAHAWTEVWLNNRWTRIDPTAVVSPERIEQGVQNSGLEISRLPLLLVSDSKMLKNMAFLYDSFQNSWNQWVIGFDQKKQDELLKSLGLESASLSNLILLLVSSMSFTGLIIAWLVFKQNHSKNDRVQNYYNRFCRKMQRYGIERHLNEGPVDFEQRLLLHKKFSIKDRNKISFIMKAYRLLHYGNRNNEKLEKNYRNKIKKFRLSK